MPHADKSTPNGSLRRLRLVVGVVLTTIITFMLLADAVAGSLGIRADYRVEPVILGTLIGALLLVIGIEVGSRWPWLGGGSSGG